LCLYSGLFFKLNSLFFEKLVTRENLPKIEQMLKDWDEVVREAGVKAFEKLRTQKDLPKIEQMLKDWNEWTRFAAVKAFEKLGTKDDIPKIQKMLDDVTIRSTAYDMN
jgi:HEAT repeat protein